ncbi:luciferase family oxidoreductase group 1 [Salsuginibacillus halophilus]|uniref:Luciferase family oxidoreductase group 1 n=1 Tax=Salsuginibacillus halophilus TaxID=517424 RepID=A0A2P8HBH8_9BACI|nr:LLM class flavin-dependent oxidoreductase [Salsuginibacillus halophilus]PSL43578.1 luciferase family oxidoreductase group 1 [Salsuginibacillus halophilus]
MYSINILDQSPVAVGETPAEALRNTVKLAETAEACGYDRFWVSEHHDTPSLAGSSPEVLLAHIAAKTSTIKLGSGGVLLPHYSAYKVAEQFKVLSALAPGRIELGVGRAPGGMPRATMALQEGTKRDVARYPEQIEDVLSYLHDTLEEHHPYYGLKATPQVAEPPQMWILASTPGSAELAAKEGLPLCFAHFINPADGREAVDYYLKNFTPSPGLPEPKLMIAVFVVCADTEEKAEEEALIMDDVLLSIEYGKQIEGIPTKEEVAMKSYTSFEQDRIKQNRERMFVGTGDSIRQQVDHLQHFYPTENWMFVSLARDFEMKRQGYEQISNSFFDHV